MDSAPFWGGDLRHMKPGTSRAHRVGFRRGDTSLATVTTEEKKARVT